MTFALGEKVKHDSLGVGVIREFRYSGYQAMVSFETVDMWIPAINLQKTVRTPSKVVRGSGRLNSHLPPGENYFLRTVIESMRLGIVPDGGLQDWTVGRDREFGQVDQWLEDEAEGTLIAKGRYGSGKTHLLRHLAQRGLEQGFAVSLVRIDPGEENSSFPMRFYAQVMRNLQVPSGDSTSGIRETLNEIATRRKRSSIDAHPFLGRLMRMIRLKQANDDDWRSLMGERSTSRMFPTNLDFTTVANLACNLLSGISHALSHDLSLNGLLVLVDEVETAEIGRYSYHRKRTMNFLRGISLTANDDDYLIEEVKKRPALGAHVGKETGLVYSGHHANIPYYYRFPSRLKIMLALTDIPTNRKLRAWQADQSVVELSNIETTALVQLFNKFSATYKKIHNIELPPGLEEWVFSDLLMEQYYSGSIRGFTRAMVEVFDFRRHYPDRSLKDIHDFGY